MSADNWIYILHTKDKWKYNYIWYEMEKQNSPIDAYRIALVQTIDNFDWYEKNEIHNLWYYMNEEWWDNNVYYSFEEAMEVAHILEWNYWWTKYEDKYDEQNDRDYFECIESYVCN